MPRINKKAIDLLTREFKLHKKGLPEWLKNSREAYLRSDFPEADRKIVVSYSSGTSGNAPSLECIDFVGVSGDDIDKNYLEWAKPDAADRRHGSSDIEGGQGNGGKAYLRALFTDGFFASIFSGKLSVVSFRDSEKYELEFVPDTAQGKDYDGDNPKFPIREYAREVLRTFGFPEGHNITIVRGIAPRPPIKPLELLEEIQQFPQARLTIQTCSVMFCQDGRLLRRLEVVPPERHPEFPEPIVVQIPPVLLLDGQEVPTSRLPEYEGGELTLNIAAYPLKGQAWSTWNRIDFYGKKKGCIGYRAGKDLPVRYGEYANRVFGECRVPLLVDPVENYESQGRGELVEGSLSSALYAFIAEEADKALKHLADNAKSRSTTKRSKDLQKLNTMLKEWLEKKLTAPSGLVSEEGTSTISSVRKARNEPTKSEHKPARVIEIHRNRLSICAGVPYQLRCYAYDEDGRRTLPGRITWRSANSAVATVHPEKGELYGNQTGLTTIRAENELGLQSEDLLVHVIVPRSIQIRNASPVVVGSARRVLLATEVQTGSGRSEKECIVRWSWSEPDVATVSQDGYLIGGLPGVAEVWAHAREVKSDPLEVIVEKSGAGRPLETGKGAPSILLSGQDHCPFDKQVVTLDPTDPPVHQRPHKPDLANNVFWINLQHPLAQKLQQMGPSSLQWRNYHFERMVDVYSILQVRRSFGEDEQLDVEKVLTEIYDIKTKIYSAAEKEICDVLVNPDYHI